MTLKAGDTVELIKDQKNKKYNFKKGCQLTVISSIVEAKSIYLKSNNGRRLNILKKDADKSIKLISSKADASKDVVVSSLITRAQDCNIRTFINCLFEKDYSGLGEGAGPKEFDKIYTEYVDMSGISATKEYEILRSIHNIHSRQVFVEAMVWVLKEGMMKFGKPFKDEDRDPVQDLKRYGHRLTWDEDKPQLFIDQLERVLIKEKTFKARLDVYEKDLKILRKHGVNKKDETRQDFIRMLNSLARSGYKIDRDKTDMEELALMMKENDENVRAEANRKRE